MNMVVLKLTLWTLFGLIFSTTSATYCPKQCECQERVILCGDIPISDVSLKIGSTEVHLTNLDANRLFVEVFMKNALWTQMQSLDITCAGQQKLYNRVFMGLGNLTKLGFHNENLFHMGNDVFQGLDSLKELNFSGQKRLFLIDILPSLRNSDLVYLERVTLSYIQKSYAETLELGFDFFRSLSGSGKRNIKYIDLSHVNIGILDFASFVHAGLCRSFEEFILRYNHFKNFYNSIVPTCENFKILDISHSLLPNLFDFLLKDIDFFCQAMSFYYNIEEIYMDSMVMSVPIRETSELHFQDCPLRLRKVSLANNRLELINISVSDISNMMKKSLSWIDVSGNQIEYLSPRFFSPSVNLKHINLSKNNLGKMQTLHNHDFETFLMNNNELRFLGLAGNNIDKLPLLTLQNKGKLVKLDLSDNRLVDLNFNVDDLRSIQTLNLSNNLMESLSAVLMHKFDLMSTANGSMRHLDISGNPFVCSCDDEHRESIEWIRKRNGTLIDGYLYACLLNGKEITFLENKDYATVLHYCKIQKMKAIVAVVVSLLVVFVVVFVAAFLLVKRKSRRQLERQRLFDSIKLGQFRKKNLVFLSFCSEDADLVEGKIRPRVIEGLRELTQYSGELVCSGDLSFRPGFQIGEEIIRCIEDSAVTIIVVSNSFCTKQWCKREVQESYDQNNPMIILLVEHVEPNVMGKVLMKLFKRFAHASWIADDDGGHIEPNWSILCQSIIDLATRSDY
ncbi:P-granule-associated novel protein 1-like [Mya arenaria]|uniref:P-granule-associated novel protein 1-like n=1 Tax=Mya arenaria TaxID=6604 RepID=UPI0022E87E9A|nr:P-granule-associated novel protein 1-like [Mya arenaria]